MNDKEEYGIHVRNLKQALNQGLVLKEKSAERHWTYSKSLAKTIQYINAKLRKKYKKYFKKGSFKLINNVVYGKTIENMRKHRDIKLAGIEKNPNYLVLESNYHTAKCFSENILVLEMKKNKKQKQKQNKYLSLNQSI